MSRKRAFPLFRLSWCFILLSLWNFSTCLAQEDESADKQVWVDLTKYYPLDKRVQLGGDTGLRGFFAFDDEWTAFFIRPSMTYVARGNLSFHGGVGLFYAFQDGHNDAWEVRPWAGVRLSWPRIGPLPVEHYFRAEERFIRIESRPDFQSVLRLRYRFGTNVPLSPDNGQVSRFYVPLSYEFFMNAGGDVPARFVNNTRFVLGLGCRVTPKWRIELNYTLISFRGSTRDSFYTAAHVFRIQIRG